MLKYQVFPVATGDQQATNGQKVMCKGRFAPSKEATTISRQTFDGAAPRMISPDFQPVSAVDVASRSVRDGQLPT